MLKGTHGQNMLERLGVGPLINGHHWRTLLGGSIMLPEVLDAMVESADTFLNITELHQKAGEYIAELSGADMALVTAGCTGAQLLQAAACMTGIDESKVSQLPDTTGMKNEILIGKPQANHYDGAFRLAGAKVIEVGTETDTTPDELANAINDKTAAVAYTWVMRWKGLSLEETLRIAHDRDVPVILDAASELPPVENLTKFIRMGVDMVAFSGGKGLRAPQSTGILIGRKDLMEAAYLNAFSFNKPKASIGRPMKIAKEEIVGLITALEIFVNADHEAEWADWRAKSQVIVDAMQNIPHVSAHVYEGPVYPGPNAPTAVITLDDTWTGPTAAEITEQFRNGDPPIYIGDGPATNVLWVAPVALKDGEAELIAKRLVGVLSLVNG
jgi:D-glucosaminate-6-phosphate ammonia-lyase